MAALALCTELSASIRRHVPWVPRAISNTTLAPANNATAHGSVPCRAAFEVVGPIRCTAACALKQACKPVKSERASEDMSMTMLGRSKYCTTRRARIAHPVSTVTYSICGLLVAFGSTSGLLVQILALCSQSNLSTI